MPLLYLLFSVSMGHPAQAQQPTAMAPVTPNDPVIVVHAPAQSPVVIVRQPAPAPQVPIAVHQPEAPPSDLIEVPIPESETSNLQKRSLVIEGQFSPVGGPYGHAGAAVDYSVAPWLALNAGIGAGGSGPQYGASLRPRIPFGSSHGIALGVTMGISHGEYEGVCVFYCEHTTMAATWGNIGPALEFRPDIAFSLRVNLGVSKLLNATERNDALLPYGTVAVGVAI